MRPRIRPLSNLYHRWGEALNLNAEDVFRALEASGLVERVSPDSYRERTTKRVSRDDFERTVNKILQSYKQTKGNEND